MNDDTTIIRNTSATFALKNTTTGEVFEIGDNTTVGRRKECDIEIADSHISRLHATLKVSGVLLHLVHEGSENGTYLNGERIQEATLQAGDQAKFDSHEFIVLGPASESEAKAYEAPQEISETEDNSPPQQSSKETLVLPEVWADAREKISSVKSKKSAPEEGADSLLKEELADSNYETEMNARLGQQLSQKEKNKAEEEEKRKARRENIMAEIDSNVTYLFGYHSLVFDEVFALNKERLFLGKSPDTDICLKDPSVSSKHAEIFSQNNHWYVKDLSSTNGTFVNGQQILEDTKLKQGDFLQFGLIQLVFGQQEPLSYSPSSPYLKWLAIGGATLALGALAAFLFFRQ